MEVEIYIENYKQVHKNLIEELKNRKATIIKENTFGIRLELNVNSFDEIICFLEKYSKEIEITLYIRNTNEVSLYISSGETSSLGDQVE